MKKIIVYGLASLALSGLAGGLASCSDDDDDSSSSNTVSDESVVASDEEALALVNGAYGPLQTLSSSLSFLVEIATESGISFEGEEDADGPLVSRLEHDETTWYPVKVFNRFYSAIGTLNDAIEKIESSSDVSETSQTEYVAKAKFLRGLCYSWLVQLYGEVPLVISADETIEDHERNSIDDVYGQIVSDLEDAEDGLPQEYTQDPVEPTRYVAEALLARVYLTWGCNPLDQDEVEAIVDSREDPAFTTDADKLEKAVEYADKVISSGYYELLDDFTQLYGRANESNKSGGKEHVFTISHDGDSYDEQGNHQTHCAFTYPFELAKDNHLTPADIELLTDWQERDLADSVRRDWSYTTYVENYEEDNKGYYYLPPITLPRWGKGVDRSYTNSENETILENDVDRIEMRYAEVLLIKAEALVELGEDLDEALSLLNQLQERAGATPYTEATRAAVRQEWEDEFVYEQKSWLNRVRWKTLISSVLSVENFTHYATESCTAGPLVKLYENDGTAVYQNEAFFAKVYKHLNAKYNNIKGKFYRFPIPTGESGNDLGIEPQNPGY